ncbi:related to cell cycle control protein cwf15 [Ustilago trichophora]|uniref:Related to cell cycle control protein cwf15 n=1 Tax=Ustilago trichophora TaxID=86804 RepID=A0A5C3EJ52_9BASI|nr:related to cell cycle control protein cwf15 [Ustilago trichophora]
MSTAHRPNFTAAKGRESKAHLSQQRTEYDLPSHTSLKFRQPPTAAPSSSGSSSSAAGRRDLKRELEVAEWEAKNKKRVRAGLEPLPMPMSGSVKVEADENEDEEVKRRREAIAAAIELDRDSDASSSSSSSSGSSDSGNDNDDQASSKHPTTTATATVNNDNTETTSDDVSNSQHSDSSSDQEDSDDEEDDEQAQLLNELAKIKAERVAEKARLASLSASEQQLSRQEEIALGNPLLNLQNAFSSSSSSSSLSLDSSTVRNNVEKDQGGVDFGVKKRWDDDVIFKNQARAAGDTAKQDSESVAFVNDLTRSDFHRKFMNRYIK